MKNYVFLLVTLLLMCALIPLQRANAIDIEVVGDSSPTTTTADTDDIIFTIRFTSEAGEKRLLVYDTGASSPEDAKLITESPATLNIDGAGTHDVTVTIPREIITFKRTAPLQPTPPTQQYNFTFIGGDALDTSFLFQVPLAVNVIIPTHETIDITLDVVEKTIQNLTADEVKDITFTLTVTNDSEVSNLQIDLEVLESEWPGNLGPEVVTLDPDSVTLAPNASGEVTLTIPEHAIMKSQSYFATVSAAPKGGFAELVTVRINISPTSGLVLEGLDDLTQTSTTADTEDVTYALRLTNTGSDLDRVDFTLVSDVDIATLDRTEVELFPDSFEDLTLTIPRAGLEFAGTYQIVVLARSSNNTQITDSVLTETIIINDPSKQNDETDNPPKQNDNNDNKMKQVEIVLSEFMFEAGDGEDGLPQWIEVYNNSDTTLNLRGWKLRWKSLLPNPLEAITTCEKDFLIPAQQARLIVTALGRHSGGGNLSENSVYQLPPLPVEEPGQDITANHIQHITDGGFSIKLTNSNEDLIDHIGTLKDDKQTWELPESLIEGVRSSLIRRFDEGVPRPGTERRGWLRAFDAKRLVLGVYYGHPTDLGTPGYRRGKPLPVQLSQFSAKFVNDEVVIDWTTESELNNAGFNIYRSTSPIKDFHPINTKLIQGAGTTGERNTYQFIDKTANPDVAYYYRLEDVDLTGKRGLFTTYRLRGVITPTGKRITTWGTLKDDR